MPQSLRTDIDWHRARIAFYEQALETLNAEPDFPDRDARLNGLVDIIADLKRTLVHLERELAGRT